MVHWVIANNAVPNTDSGDAYGILGKSEYSELLLRSQLLDGPGVFIKSVLTK
jgi:hypothetical protein